MIMVTRLPGFLLLLLFMACLSACGGGGGSSPTPADSGSPTPQPETPTPDSSPQEPDTVATPDTSYTAGVFRPSSEFARHCAAPRSGTNPVTGNAYRDVQGSVLTENHWLRSWSHETYLWYDEISDRDPADFDDPRDYFAIQKTDAITPNGNPKDRFHYTETTAAWQENAQEGISVGYGLRLTSLDSTPPDRRIVIDHVENPAVAGPLTRGTSILEVDGIEVATAEKGDALNAILAGLYPAVAGERHEFLFEDRDGRRTRRTLEAKEVMIDPVQNVSVFPTTSGKAGYMLFSRHIPAAETELSEAVTRLQSMAGGNLNDLIVDMRFNGGGYLSITSQLAYMIAGPARTRDRVFERPIFNDKHPDTNPLTGETPVSLPFFSQTTGLHASAGQNLPTLDLDRVYILTSPMTCSASESLINALRGVGVEVIQIGRTTCGKPYGFYPRDNCGTTYFTIHFRGENDVGFSDFGDGFSPQNTRGQAGVTIPGCAVIDHPVNNDLPGNRKEWLLRSALHHIDTGVCYYEPPAARTLSSQSLTPHSLGSDSPPPEDLLPPQSFSATNKLLGLPGQ